MILEKRINVNCLLLHSIHRNKYIIKWRYKKSVYKNLTLVNFDHLLTMLVEMLSVLFLSNFLILSAKATVFNIINQNGKIDILAERTIFSSPCVVGLVNKYLQESYQAYGTTVILSVMSNTTLSQRNYLEALNSFNELTYMVKRPDTFHYSADKLIEKAQLYLMFLSDADDIPMHLKLIKTLQTYNTYAKIIGFLLVDMTDNQFALQRKKAITILFEMDFFDIFIFGLRPNSSVLQSYTMFPYDNGNCARKVNDIELVHECELLVKSEDKPLTVLAALELSQHQSHMRYIEYKKIHPKLPGYIRGCEISVTGTPFEPYVVVSKRTSRIRRGLEVELMNATFHEMGATVKFLTQDPRLRYKKRTLNNETSVYKAILNK